MSPTSKDETPAFVINLLKQLQVGLNKTVRFVRTDNDTEFMNKALTDYYESVGITHEKTVPRTPQQNGVVERRNRTLVEAARTMLIFSKAPLFLWVSDIFLAPCFVNGLETYNGEINLGVEENMISNEYAVKLCLEHEVKRGNKLAKKELIVALRGEIYFVKFIINPEEDDIEPEDHLLDFNIDDIPLMGEEGLPPFICKMRKSSRNKKRATENLNFFYQDIGTSHQLEGEALKEKEDPEAFIFPIRLEGHVNENALADTRLDINNMPFWLYVQLGRDDMKKVDRGITMINHTKAEAMGILPNVLYQVGVTTLIAKFLILDILIDRDSSIVVGRGFLRTIESIINTPERLFSTFYGIRHQTFHAARSNFMRNAKSNSDDDAGSSRSKRSRYETVEEVLLPQVHHEFLLWEGCNRDAKSRMGCDGEIDDMLRIRVREAESNEEIFTLVAWIRAFNINEPIYAELCHEFYSTYEFDQVCADDELQTKKIIKFRLGGCAHSLTLLEFALRLGLYQAVELEEDGLVFTLKEESYFYYQETNFEGDLLNDHLWFVSKDDWRKGVRTKKESQIFCGQFISKLARKCRVLTEDVDLYDRMGRMEIRQEAIEQMEYRQSYHWDRYQGVFEHMVGVYSVPMQRAYNPPGYA
ncbi:reverse transcriptase domain-containing protein [Tanacetum coccineum]